MSWPLVGGIVVTELRGIRAAQRAEERVERANFVWGQPGMFGTGKMYSELDNLSLAQVLKPIRATLGQRPAIIRRRHRER